MTTAVKTKRKEIKRIEAFLRDYEYYKTGIMNMKKQLEYIMPGVTVNYEQVSGTASVFRVSNPTEKFAIDRIESRRAVELREEIAKYEIIVKSIEESLKNLSDIEQQFVRVRYFKKKSIQQTAMELGYSEKYVFNLRNQVLGKLLISLKGLLQL